MSEEVLYNYGLAYEDGSSRSYTGVTELELRHSQFIPRNWRNNRPTEIRVDPQPSEDTCKRLYYALDFVKDSSLIVGGVIYE